MFNSQRKINSELLNYLKNNIYKTYRVIIKYTLLEENICKKIKNYKDTLLYKLSPINIICAILKESSIRKLLDYPEIEYITLDEYGFLSGISVSSANKFHLTGDNNLSGIGVSIGVVDSGVYPHKDLITPFNKITYFYDTINHLNYPYDDNGHGTCTCGILSGSGLCSDGIYRGIAINSEIHMYKAFDKLGKGLVSDILFSISSLIENSPIKILCLPFEILTHNTFIINLFDDLFKKAIAKNIIPIVPSSSINGPLTGICNLNSCITIGGVDSTSATPIPYKYSGYNNSKKYKKPNLCANCVNIVSLNCDNNYISERNGIKLYTTPLKKLYKTFSGNSISCAFMSGICAILCEYKCNLSFKDVNGLIKLSCESNNLDKKYCGEGLININKLLG